MTESTAGAEIVPIRPGIIIPSANQRALDFATKRELGKSEQDVAFSARIWAQVSLPYRDPGNVPYWERRNGDVVLTVRPALIRDPHTKDARMEYPYGALPRQALIWMSTEAVRTNERVLELGRSMSQFMEKLGLARNGQNIRRLKENMERLFGAQLSVEGLTVTEDGHGTSKRYWSIADSVDLWYANNDENEANPGLWSSSVELSQPFFDSIVGAPVPIDMEIVRALGSSPMRIDQYIWLTHRMYYLTKPTRIKWEDVELQFGAQFNRTRTFRAKFIENLKVVAIAYPELRFDLTNEHLILRPSPTSVASRKAGSMALPKSSGSNALAAAPEQTTDLSEPVDAPEAQRLFLPTSQQPVPASRTILEGTAVISDPPTPSNT